MKRDLDGKIILLAGGTGGLGQHLARGLMAEGAEIVHFGRDHDRIADLDARASRSIGDIGDPEACRRAVQTAIETYGQLDGVVNTTGIVAFGPLDELADETIDDLLHTNLVGPTYLMRAALSEMERGGFFANVSAVVAERPQPGMAFYSATKAALTALGQALARELRSARIDVVDLRPPHMETGLSNRPIAGTPPALPQGKCPSSIARRIIDAIKAGEREVPASAFA